MKLLAGPVKARHDRPDRNSQRLGGILVREAFDIDQKDDLAVERRELLDGFYDQSHVIREIKYFTGMTPRVFAEQPTELNREIAKRIALERQNPIRRSGVIT